MGKKHRVAFIGTGLPWGEEGATGFGMAYPHAEGYVASKRCELVAAADIVESRVRRFSGQFGVEAVYTDYKRMLREVKPDIVSIATWPHLHAEMVIATAKSSGLKAIHCEKPMAPTWGEAQRMAAACEKTGVKLTFNHQRRFLAPFQIARELANDGTVGELVRIEGACADLIDWGTHWFDMFFFFIDQCPAVWVIGQIDSREERPIFGLPTTNQGQSQVKYESGVRGLMFTGHDNDIGCMLRLIGSHGVVELHNEAPHVRYRGHKNAAWKSRKGKGGLHGGLTEAIIDVVASVDEKRESQLKAANALQASEVIFATYESSRRRARIDLPLKPKDSAFLSMIESGDLKPKKRPKQRKK